MSVSNQPGNILLVAQQSALADALPQVMPLGTSVQMLRLTPMEELTTFDLSADAKLSQSLARSEADRAGIRRFVQAYFATHVIPGTLMICLNQYRSKAGGAAGTPLRHFAAACALLDAFLSELSHKSGTRIIIVNGLDATDFFGHDHIRIGYRALESYIKALDTQYRENGIALSYLEYLDPERMFDQQWPKSAVGGFLRSLHPYAPGDAARQLYTAAMSGGISSRPLRTAALFWLGQWHRMRGRETPARQLPNGDMFAAAV
jgi:hypothetical protein